MSGQNILTGSKVCWEAIFRQGTICRLCSDAILCPEEIFSRDDIGVTVKPGCAKAGFNCSHFTKCMRLKIGSIFSASVPTSNFVTTVKEYRFSGTSSILFQSFFVVAPHSFSTASSISLVPFHQMVVLLPVYN